MLPLVYGVVYRDIYINTLSQSNNMVFSLKITFKIYILLETKIRPEMGSGRGWSGVSSRKSLSRIITRLLLKIFLNLGLKTKGLYLLG